MKTRLLLDTCAVIWIAREEPMATDAEAAIDASFADDLAVGVSPITAWELGLLERRGRLPATVSSRALFERFASTEGIQIEALPASILIDSSFLPGDFHNDPADRIIVATARASQMTVVTRDRAILDYARKGYVLALAC
jgi:PIN domain nuclease of toxin-antitoxin system